MLAFSYSDLAHLALAFFLIALGVGIGWAFLRLAVTFDRLSSLIKGTEREVLPVINKVGGSVDRVNTQLDKMDTATTSAVDAVVAVDEAVRTVSFAVKRPVQKLAGFTTGVSHGWSSLRTDRNWRERGRRGQGCRGAARARPRRRAEADRWLMRSRSRCHGSRDFQSVAHLVLGGLAARLNLTLENLEDLQLALTALLGRGDGPTATAVTVRMTIRDDALEIVVGPLDRQGPRRRRSWRARRARHPARARVDGRRHPRRRRLGAADEAGRRLGENDKELLRRYHEQGDLQAREQLIEQYLSLVRSLARRYSYRGEQFDDLVQIGSIGLIKAIDRFDLERGVELTTYATPNIIGEIKRHFRDRGWAVRVPRGLQELNAQLSKLVERADRGARPLADDRRAREGRRRRRGSRARGARVGACLHVACRCRRAGRPRTARSSIRSSRSATSSPSTRSREDRALLAPGFKVLDDRERMILQLRFFEGLTQSEIAQQVGISQMHVSRLIRRSLEKIRDEIDVDDRRARGSRSRRLIDADRPRLHCPPWR